MNAVFTFLVLLMVTIGCQQGGSPVSVAERTAAIKVAIMYPHTEGESFDLDYYSNRHMPMVAGLFGDSLVSYTIDKGLSGRSPEEPAAYVAIGTFYFEKLSAYRNSFGANSEAILNDIPNYTNIQPLVQISEVVR